MGTDSTKAKVIRFNEDTESIETVEELNTWAIVADGDAGEYTGITVALNDGRDIVIEEETLAAMGYIPAS